MKGEGQNTRPAAELSNAELEQAVQEFEQDAQQNRAEQVKAAQMDAGQVEAGQGEAEKVESTQNNEGEENKADSKAEKAENVSEAMRKYLGKETSLLSQLDDSNDINLVVQTKDDASYENEVIKGTEKLMSNFEDNRVNTGKLPAKFFKRAVYNIGKPFVALHNSRKFKKAYENNNGNLEETYKSLGLEYKEGNAAKEAEAVKARARLATVEKGYLISGESVNEFEGEKKEYVNKMLADLHEKYKAANSPEDLEKIRKEFEEELHNDERLHEEGDKAKSDVSDIMSMAKAIENIARHEEFGTKQIEEYLNKHVSLYDARLKEGINTELKSDMVVDAVVRGGVTGLVFAFGFTAGRSGASMISKSFLGKIISSSSLTGAAVGAGIGFGAGFIKGYSEGKEKLSKAEAEAAEGAEALFEDKNAEETKADKPEEGNEKAEGEEGVEQENDSKAEKKKGIFSKIRKEEELLSEIEEKRDRKSAKELYDNLDRLISEEKTPENIKELMDAVADLRARLGVSNELKIDLISYSKDNVDEERLALFKKAVEAEKLLFGQMGDEAENEAKEGEKEDGAKDNEEKEGDEKEDGVEEGDEKESGMKKAVEDLIKEKAEKYKESASEAKELEKSFIRRQGMARAIQGAIAGGVAGAVAGGVKDYFAGTGLFAETSTGTKGTFHFEDRNSDGSLEMYGEKGEVVVDDLHYNKATGQIDESDLALLRSKGVNIEENYIETGNLPDGRPATAVDSYFSRYNENYVSAEDIGTKGIEDPGNTVTSIGDADSNMQDMFGNDRASIGSAKMINEGDFTFKVSSGDRSVNVDDLKVVLSPPNEVDGTGVVLDVAEDGTVTVPAGSTAASMFDGNGNFMGGEMNVVRDATFGDGYEIIAQSEGAGTLTHVYSADAMPGVVTYTVNGESGFSIPKDYLTEANNSGSINEALRAAESNAEKYVVGERGSIEVDGLGADNKVEQLNIPTHKGGYTEVDDPFLSPEKESPALNSKNLVREALKDSGRDVESMSNAEADAALIEAVNNGTVSTEQVTNAYLEQMGNSPEQIVEMRAMMGGLVYDIDGDGVGELIDTDSEINAVADLIKDSGPEQYDNFVNETYSMLYEKMQGGEIRLINYSEEPYDYTTLGYLEKLKNNVIHLFAKKESKSNGIGIEFLDKEGKSIYDLDIVRKVWKLSKNASIDHVTERLNCGQKTANVSWAEVANQTTSTGTGDEGTGDESTGTEDTGTESTGVEPTGDEPTGDEPTGIEPTGDEPTGEEPTGIEPTGDEPTGEEPTGTEIVGKTDTNPWEGNNPEKMPVTRSFEEVSADNDGARIVQRTQEELPEIDRSGVNMNPEDQQDWAAQPTAAVEDTGTGGTVDMSADNNEDAAEMLRQAEEAQRAAQEAATNNAERAANVVKMSSAGGGGGGTTDVVDEEEAERLAREAAAREAEEALRMAA